MNRRSGCTRRPAGAARRTGTREGARAGLPRWKAPRARERQAALTCRRPERAHATGKRRFKAHGTGRPKKVPEARIDGSPGGRQSPGAFQPPPQKESGSRSGRSRRRAVKHGAAGGRMTARRSGAGPWTFHGGNAGVEGPSRSRTLAGFPRRVDRQSPEVMSRASARDVNVGCRNGFAASWRSDRG
jgi:hypothetical protein